MNIAEDVLIEYIKPNLKAKGFKKKNKRWLKTEGEFILPFLIQGSNYDKDTYYEIRRYSCGFLPCRAKNPLASSHTPI